MLKKIQDIKELDDSSLKELITGAKKHFKLCAIICSLIAVTILLLPLDGLDLVDFIAGIIVIPAITLFLAYCNSEIKVASYELWRRSK